MSGKEERSGFPSFISSSSPSRLDTLSNPGFKDRLSKTAKLTTAGARIGKKERIYASLNVKLLPSASITRIFKAIFPSVAP